MNALDFVPVPPGVTTATATVPVPAGALHVMRVSLTTVKLVADAPPNVTSVASRSLSIVLGTPQHAIS